MYTLIDSTEELPTGPGTLWDCIEIENVTGNKLNITFGTEDFALAGSHHFELRTRLTNYQDVPEKSLAISMTFFELKANLTLPNIEYTLASGPLEIVIPQIIFNPPLHESSNPDTGVNGA